MTAADPRDGLHGLVEKWRRMAHMNEPVVAYVLRDVADELEAGLAHARPEAVNEAAALDVLLDALSDEHGGEHHEDGCDVCRAIATLTPERAP